MNVCRLSVLITIEEETKRTNSQGCWHSPILFGLSDTIIWTASAVQCRKYSLGLVRKPKYEGRETRLPQPKSSHDVKSNSCASYCCRRGERYVVASFLKHFQVLKDKIATSELVPPTDVARQIYAGSVAIMRFPSHT